MREAGAVQSIENAIGILNLLAKSRAPMRLIDISRRLAINNSTCLSIIRTLIAHDAVALDIGTKRYRIGGYFREVVNTMEATDQRDRAVSELMSKMARDLKVLVTVWTRTDEHTLTLTSAFESNREMRIVMEVGQTRPIYFGSIGRMFAAIDKAGDQTLRTSIAGYRWAQMPPANVYLQEVREARERGWSVDYGWAVEGMCSISVPLNDRDGEITRCCCAGMFNPQYDDEGTRQSIVKRLQEISDASSMALE